MATVAIIGASYGDYRQFERFWQHSVDQLERYPEEVLLGGSRTKSLAQNLNELAEYAHTDWIWRLDVDDRAISTGLNGIDDIDADVWQLGYIRGDGLAYVPPKLSNAEFLGMNRNPYAGSGMIRRETLLQVGGWPEIGFEDWGLWRRLAQIGAEFAHSDRAHFLYVPNNDGRTATEFDIEHRQRYYEEMMDDVVHV